MICVYLLKKVKANEARSSEARFFKFTYLDLEQRFPHGPEAAVRQFSAPPLGSFLILVPWIYTPLFMYI